MRLRFCGSGWVWIYVAVPKCWLAGRAPRGWWGCKPGI
jgi:hypothetical protein